MPTRRQFLLAGALKFVATPALGEFKHPVHSHSDKIEARLKVWHDHVEAQHDYLLKSREAHIRRWREWSGKIPNMPESSFLEGVNKLINEEVRYRSDSAVHQTSDFWATISDALIHGGDCEDYALAKATTLAWHGWPEKRSHLVVRMLRRAAKPEAHAVLVAERSDGTFWVLDDLSQDVIPAEKMDMQPFYGVEGEGVWLFSRSKAG